MLAAEQARVRHIPSALFPLRHIPSYVEYGMSAIFPLLSSPSQRCEHQQQLHAATLVAQTLYEHTSGSDGATYVNLCCAVLPGSCTVTFPPVIYSLQLQLHGLEHELFVHGAHATIVFEPYPPLEWDFRVAVYCCQGCGHGHLLEF